MIASPWLLVGALGATIVAFGAGTYIGRALCQNGYFKAEVKQRARVDAKIVEAQDQDAQAVARDIERETIVREITREIPKIIDRPVCRNVCFDADGVRLLERAVIAANGGGASSSGADGGAAPSGRAASNDRP